MLLTLPLLLASKLKLGSNHLNNIKKDTHFNYSKPQTLGFIYIKGYRD